MKYVAFLMAIFWLFMAIWATTKNRLDLEIIAATFSVWMISLTMAMRIEEIIKEKKHE